MGQTFFFLSEGFYAGRNDKNINRTEGFIFGILLYIFNDSKGTVGSELVFSDVLFSNFSEIRIL